MTTYLLLAINGSIVHYIVRNCRTVLQHIVPSSETLTFVVNNRLDDGKIIIQSVT